MSQKFTLVALLALLVSPASAGAASIDFGASQLNGNSVVDHSGLGALSFDVQISSPLPIQLVVQLDPTESSVSWNGYYERATNAQYPAGYEVAFSGATLTQGSVHDTMSVVINDVTLSSGDSQADMVFDPRIFSFHVGQPPGLLAAGASDWQVSAPSAGATLSVTLTPLPEAGGAALLSVGFLALFALRGRRQQR